ncbi:MAG: hypothetical protein JHD16_00090 [Solirubrobacteraceae bacterium]|nr:hypothetical protein [Solirubrobacteraceae bacterium]
MNRHTHLNQVTHACPNTDGQVSATLDHRGRISITIDGHREQLCANGGRACRHLLVRLVTHVAEQPERLDECLAWLAAVERRAIDDGARGQDLHCISGLRYDLVSEVVDVRHLVPDTVAA